MQRDRELTVCFAGTFDPTFGRNRKLMRAATQQGMSVEACSVEIWGRDRLVVAARQKTRAAFRGFLAYPRLLWRLARATPPDVFVVGYPGWFDVPVVAMVGRLRGVPVLFDMFISLFDTVAVDRKLVKQNSMTAWFVKIVDRVACRLATRIIADTPIHANFFSELTGVDRERFGVVWLGAADDLFAPQPVTPHDRLVVFHGTFIPLQGLETIIGAAKLLEDREVRFEIIGDGQERPKIERLMAELDASNVELTGLLPIQEIPKRIAKATVCLGIFGKTAKTQRVVPHKVFECLAVGRPVITGDTPAVRAAFAGNEVATCPVAEPKALAETIWRLVEDGEERERIAVSGHRRYRDSYSEEVLAALFGQEVLKAIDEGRRID